MLLKGILVICVPAAFFKAVFTQCIRPYPGDHVIPANSPAIEGYNAGVGGPVAPLYGRVIGGNLLIDTSAPYAPTGPAGITIFSDDLLIEGVVFVTGNMPFLGTVALEGVVPAAGTSTVSYECGAGNLGITNESIPTATQISPGSRLEQGLGRNNALAFGGL